MRALARLRSLGLLRWQCRLVRTRWRAEQTSNAYVLTPATASGACDLQTAGAVNIDLKKKEAQEAERVAPEVRQAARETLAAIAARRMRLLGFAC